MRSRRSNDGKIVRRLASPIFEVAGPSCLSFRYFGNSDSEIELAHTVRTIAVSLGGSTSDTIWKVQITNKY